MRRAGVPGVRVSRGTAARRHRSRSIAAAVAGYIGLSGNARRHCCGRLVNRYFRSSRAAVFVCYRYRIGTGCQTCNRGRAVAGWSSIPVVGICSCTAGNRQRDAAVVAPQARNVHRRSAWRNSIRLGNSHRKRSSGTDTVRYRHRVGSGCQASQVLVIIICSLCAVVRPVVGIWWCPACHANINSTCGIAEAAGDIGLHCQRNFYCCCRACTAYRLEANGEQVVVGAVYQPGAVVHCTAHLAGNGAAVYGAVPVTFGINCTAIRVEVNHHERIRKN